MCIRLFFLCSHEHLIVGWYCEQEPYGYIMLEHCTFSILLPMHLPVYVYTCMHSQEAATAADYEVVDAPSDSSPFRVQKSCRLTHVGDHTPEHKCKALHITLLPCYHFFFGQCSGKYECD